MGLFNRTATRRLTDGPTVVVNRDPAELLHRYDPHCRRESDKFVFGNGIRLHGPFEVTPKLAQDTGLPMGSAYYADVGATRARAAGKNPVLDHEWLVRGLAARCPGAKFSKQPWVADKSLNMSVFAPEPVAEQVLIDTLQPFAGSGERYRLHTVQTELAPNFYAVCNDEREPLFASYWAQVWQQAMLDELPPAAGARRDRIPVRWELLSPVDAATADHDTCRLFGAAALALAAVTHGVVVDMFGFPITAPEDVLPG